MPIKKAKGGKGGGGGGGGGSGNAAKGEQLFKNLCQTCHSLSVSI